MKLPPPETAGAMPVEQAIKQRRTIRSFSRRTIPLEALSQLLWAAQGITEDRGFKRAAPSAGALYPMDVYAIVGQDSVSRMDAGLYHYQAGGHELAAVVTQDLREKIARASLSQMWMARAPVSLAITAEYRRITGKYADRGVRYALIEAGHIAQNLFLQAESLGLKAGIVGAFHDNELAATLHLPRNHEVLLVMPIG